VVETVPLRELIASHEYTQSKFYTPEEEALFTRLLTALKPSPEEVEKGEKEEIKQKRIERKLAKSQKKNSNN